MGSGSFADPVRLKTPSQNHFQSPDARTRPLKPGHSGNSAIPLRQILHLIDHLVYKQKMSSTDAPTPGRRRGRPRKPPGDQTARQELIRTGLVYLTERGYCAVAVDEILRAAGVPKGSFYYHFQSKEDFGGALIGAYNEFFSSKLRSWFQRSDLSPLDRLRGFISDAEKGMEKHAFRRGCLVGNLGQEMAALPPGFRSLLSSALSDWQHLTEACLLEAQNQGEIGKHHKPEALAAFFWIGWEGAVLRAKLEQSPEPLRQFAAGFFALALN